MSRPISFLSDFGTTDEFVGVVHGVIARIAPESRVIDVTHGIGRSDVRAGALALMRSIQYLPEGVFLAVVDPGVGTDRQAIAAETAIGFFVGPDNGLLSPAVAMVGGATRIVSIENPDARIPSSGSTFHGRDVFAPAAALLASGESTLDELGPEVSPEDLVPMLLPLPEVSGGNATGEAWWVDRFGNAQTNISPEEAMTVGIGPGQQVTVKVGPRLHQLPWVESYGEVGEGHGLIHVDSSGLLALGVRNGRADDDLGAHEGIAITLVGGSQAQDPQGAGYRDQSEQ